MKRITLGILALAAAVALAFPVAAHAADPALQPMVVLQEGFEGSTSTTYTTTPVDDSQWALGSVYGYWKAITFRAHNGLQSLWCDGTNPSAVVAGQYAPRSSGHATFELPMTTDLYSSQLSFWYTYPSRGDAESLAAFNVTVYTSPGSGVVSHPYTFDPPSALTLPNQWRPVTSDLATGTLSLSRQAGYLDFMWQDKLEGGNPFYTVGEGPSIDDVTVTGWQYGPPRTLAASAITTNSVTLSWLRPYFRTTGTLLETRPLSYRVYRSLAGQNTWTEVAPEASRADDPATSQTQADSGLTQGTPYDYVVQAWDVGTGANYGVPATMTVTTQVGSGPSTGSLSGTVLLSDGATPSGVSVTAVGSGKPTQLTDTSGHYTISGLSPGVYSVTFSKSTYVAQTLSAPISAGATRTLDTTLVLAPTKGDVSGTVTRTGSGTALSGVLVTDLGTGAQTTTAGNGSYTLPSLAPGSHTLRFALAGYTSKDAAATVAAGQTTGLNVDLAAVVAPPTIARGDGANRYAVAVGLARTYRPDLRYSDVIVACGEDRAMADPLGAAGLAGAWDAPILLTSSSKLDASTADLIASIRNANGGRVNIHVIGGTTSVPKAIYNKLASLRGAGFIERINGANRYAVSATMAARLPGELASHGKGPVAGVLVANVENSKAFYDALAASPISAHAHYAILGVRTATVPGEAQAVLASSAYAGKPRYGVNAAYLSGASRAVAGSGSMASTSNRIDAAVAIARFGHDRAFVSYSTIGLANKLPDALTGGALVGQLDGVLVYTDAAPLAPATSAFAASARPVTRGLVLGGPVSVAEATKTSFAQAIGVP